jgi:hypothetical protein
MMTSYMVLKLIFFFLGWSGTKSTTDWPIVPAPDDDGRRVWSSWWNDWQETEIQGENLNHRRYVHHKSYKTLLRTRTAAVGSQRLSA